MKFEEKTNAFVRYNENLLMFVQPRFCMRVFIVKNEEIERFVQCIEEFVKNRICQNEGPL